MFFTILTKGFHFVGNFTIYDVDDDNDVEDDVGVGDDVGDNVEDGDGDVGDGVADGNSGGDYLLEPKAFEDPLNKPAHPVDFNQLRFR